ncbi:hypothetical protein [Paraburkholderia lycopersici]|uniref:Serine protease autotransporter n=1 Tax=Paraburkholderia lycopersici TaxID=416944 RepID=A0A1G6MVE9_9BURK|nr:hypothetical protein [Paraburkholderia lycopersici]SDC59187.1 hypothetical protein SAMN05421548_10897 [Paraburkholderia lycopersici]
MNKASSALIAAVAALTLSGGAYAQANAQAVGDGGSPSQGGTVGPATNPTNGATSGYGAPGAANSDSGMGSGSPPNSPLQQSTNPGPPSHTSGPKSNNSLATPSVVSPADQ